VRVLPKGYDEDGVNTPVNHTTGRDRDVIPQEPGAQSLPTSQAAIVLAGEEPSCLTGRRVMCKAGHAMHAPGV